MPTLSALAGLRHLASLLHLAGSLRHLASHRHWPRAPRLVEGAAHSDGRQHLVNHLERLASLLRSVEAVVLANPRPLVRVPELVLVRHLLLGRNRAHLVHLRLVNPLSPPRVAVASDNRRSSVRSLIPSPVAVRPPRHLPSVPSRQIMAMETIRQVPAPSVPQVVRTAAPALLRKLAQRALLGNHSSLPVPRFLWTLAQLPPAVPLEPPAPRTRPPLPLVSLRNHLRTLLASLHSPPHSPPPTLLHKLPLRPTHSAPRPHSPRHPRPRPVAQHPPIPTDRMRADSTRPTLVRKA